MHMPTTAPLYRVTGQPRSPPSKKASISAWSSIHQRGKNVVSASSGNTTSSAPRAFASCSSASRRLTTSARRSARWIGPSCAAATIMTPRTLWQNVGRRSPAKAPRRQIRGREPAHSYRDVPEERRAELQEPVDVLAKRARHHELAPRHVQHLVVGDLLDLVRYRLALGRVRVPHALRAQLH